MIIIPPSFRSVCLCLSSGGGALTESRRGGERGGPAGSDGSDDGSLRGSCDRRPAAAGSRSLSGPDGQGGVNGTELGVSEGSAPVGQRAGAERSRHVARRPQRTHAARPGRLPRRP
ncbi:hyphally regulated cell wall protein 1-like [Plectropomus leopardus]|uniref:hyphally regulated cell wall protein 1-like n=1 Tax=Plectropomus leopardus TaxID=160734 RepID=UPI001C4C0CA2|nr:hyphally regulated cell wall protein 1-like [Plectropomus leopardus]